MKSNLLKTLVIAAILLLSTNFAVSVNAQLPSVVQTAKSPTAAEAVVGTAELDSKLMNRKMPYQYILPVDYEQAKTVRYPVLYLLHGLGGNYKNWSEKTGLRSYAAKYQIIIVTVEGGSGWYTDSATQPADKYESYVVQELIPEIDKKFRTAAVREARAIGGLSMGGYGAAKFGVKYPDKFILAASLSGAVQIASWKSAEQIPQFIRGSIISIYGAPDSSTKKSNDLFALFSELPADKIRDLPFFYVSCGTEDELSLLPANQQLAAILVERKIPHEYRQRPGKHSWAFWDNQIAEVLRISDLTFSSRVQAVQSVRAAANR